MLCIVYHSTFNMCTHRLTDLTKSRVTWGNTPTHEVRRPPLSTQNIKLRTSPNLVQNDVNIYRIPTTKAQELETDVMKSVCFVNLYILYYV